jgi:hypothetical protein
MIRSVWIRAVGVALFAGVMLFGAAPALADSVSSPTHTTAIVVVVLGGLAVLVVAGLSVAALRRVSARRREAARREQRQKGDGSGGPG